MPMRFQNMATQGKASLVAAVIGCLTMVAGTLPSITGSAPLARESAKQATSLVVDVPQARIVAPSTLHAGNSSVPTQTNVVLTVPSNTLKNTQKHQNQLLPVVDQPDIEPRHRVLADATLRRLPVGCRRSLSSLYVEYGESSHRGLSGAGGMMILTGNVSDKEFRALLVHECAHIVDLADLKGTPASGITAFYDGNEPIFADDPSLGFYRISWQNAFTKKNNMRSSAFVSGYAKTDAFEDFSETFAYFALQRSEFERKAQGNPILMAKFTWMKQNVFTDPSTVVSEGKPRTLASIPWDITKLEY